MLLFRGGKLRNIDSKGRLMLPKEIMKVLLSRNPDGKMVLTAFLEKCLAIYPLADWDVIEQELNDFDMIDQKVRGLQRLLIGNAVEMQTDEQGRIRVPKELMDYAGIKDAVMVVGLGRRVELWQPELIQAETDSLADIGQIVGTRSLSL
jgi:MraZ protein